MIKITAAMLVAAVLLAAFCGCGDNRSGYMTNNCTKDGVKELLAESPELKEKGFTEKSCYNITPDGFNGITIYKSSENGHSVIKYPNYSYTYIDESDAPGLISAALCDLEGSGLYDDVLFTYANGTTKEYGIGIYNGVVGYSSSVFKSYGEMYLYLIKQKADEGMPDVYSVLTVTVEKFKNNPADLGCIATGNLGTVSISDKKPVFNIDSGAEVIVNEFSFDGIKKIIVSTVDTKKTYTAETDIKRITDFLSKIDAEQTEEKPSGDGTTYIIAAVYEDGGVSYAYINNGYFKYHGQTWKKIKGEYQLPF